MVPLCASPQAKANGQMGHPKRETNSEMDPLLLALCLLGLSSPPLALTLSLSHSLTSLLSLYPSQNNCRAHTAVRERENSHCNKKILISFLVFV